MSSGARRSYGPWVHNLWVSRRRRKCPHSRSPRSGAGLPCPSGRAPGTARGRRGRKGKEDGQEEGEEVESGEDRIKERQPPHTWMTWRWGERCKTRLEP